jgi:hypothetical protein
MLQELYKVRGVLNKLTPEKFHKLVSQVQAVPVDSINRLKGVIRLLFEKVRQPSVMAATLKYKCHIDKNALFLNSASKFIICWKFIYIKFFLYLSCNMGGYRRKKKIVTVVDYSYNLNYQ